MNIRTIPTLEEIAEQHERWSTRWTCFEMIAELGAVLIVQRRRLDALEQQARPEQEDGHLAVGASLRGVSPFAAECLAELRQRAETAERERDAWEAEFAKLAERRRVDISPLVRERDQARKGEAYVAGQNHELCANLAKQREDFARSVNTLTAERDAALAKVERLTRELHAIRVSTQEPDTLRLAAAALEDA